MVGICLIWLLKMRNWLRKMHLTILHRFCWDWSTCMVKGLHIGIWNRRIYWYRRGRLRLRILGWVIFLIRVRCWRQLVGRLVMLLRKCFKGCLIIRKKLIFGQVGLSCTLWCVGTCHLRIKLRQNCMKR